MRTARSSRCAPGASVTSRSDVDDLVIDIAVPGSELRATIGEGSAHDLFLEGGTTSSPVLFHDFAGDGWEDRLRRKIPPYLARVLGNPAYAHTFAQFLHGDDAEREEFLLELGVSQDAADAVRAHVGVVGEEEQFFHRCWFAGILATQNAASLSLDHGSLTRKLTDTSFSAQESERLIELGGGREVRRDNGPRSALRLLQGGGFDLRELHARLRGMGDPGLEIRASRELFYRWLDENRPRLQIVLETRGRSQSAEAAKNLLRDLSPPPKLEFSLEPQASDVLSPIVEALSHEGLAVDAASLAADPGETLAGLGGFETADQLDDVVDSLLSEAERARLLRELAARWREEIRLLAVLVSSGPEETRANIRALDERIDDELPSTPSSPPDLRAAVAALFETNLAKLIVSGLQETVSAPKPDRKLLLEWAGVNCNRLQRVQNALDVPRRERARKLDRDRQRLRQENVRPTPPAGLQPPEPRETKKKPGPARGPRNVRAIKVNERHDQRKRELGDEGERWALAAVVDVLMDLAAEAREAAIDHIKALLTEHFDGKPVDDAMAHAERARLSSLDDEERIEELSAFLRVSRYSDAFGFDLLGWLPPGSSNSNGKAVCLEVKSSQGEGFRFSRGEWSVAEKFHEDERGDQYAILVVRRGRNGGVPSRMDLLSDPKALVDKNLLRMDADGYEMTYSDARPRSSRRFKP